MITCNYTLICMTCHKERMFQLSKDNHSDEDVVEEYVIQSIADPMHEHNKKEDDFDQRTL